MTELAERLACPRCDKTPLQRLDDTLRCEACRVDFPFVSGIPWLFADPEAALGEWRGRLQLALQQLDSSDRQGLQGTRVSKQDILDFQHVRCAQYNFTTLTFRGLVL